MIAVGTRPARPPAVRFDERSVLDSDGILDLSSIPDALVVVGAGVIGIEYASMFAALGTKVTVVEQREHLLEFCDRQVTEALQYHLRDLGVTFRFGDAVVGVESHDGGTITHLAERQADRRPTPSCTPRAGRAPPTGSAWMRRASRPTTAGASASTSTTAPSVEHIYAVGDVIGFPSLAATAMEQGRLAAAHACGIEAATISELLPIGIYTDPRDQLRRARPRRS